MIGVPLQGGKTLQVTFRSLNTRVDFFKSQGSTTPNNAQTHRPGSIEQLSPREAVSLDREQASKGHKYIFRQSQQHEQFLKKAVQQGVMRGLTQTKRKSSRQFRSRVGSGRGADPTSSYSQSRKGSRSSPFRQKPTNAQ